MSVRAKVGDARPMAIRCDAMRSPKQMQVGDADFESRGRIDEKRWDQAW
jgi:hypothetical protein